MIFELIAESYALKPRYDVGTWESDGWVAQNFDNASVSYKYSTSLHWMPGCNNSTSLWCFVSGCQWLPCMSMGL